MVSGQGRGSLQEPSTVHRTRLPAEMFDRLDDERETARLDIKGHGEAVQVFRGALQRRDLFQQLTESEVVAILEVSH